MGIKLTGFGSGSLLTGLKLSKVPAVFPTATTITFHTLTTNSGGSDMRINVSSSGRVVSTGNYMELSTLSSLPSWTSANGTYIYTKSSAYNGTTWIAPEYTTYIWKSTNDGATWTRFSMPGGQYVGGALYDGTNFLVFGSTSNGSAYYSSNATTWTASTGLSASGGDQYTAGTNSPLGILLVENRASAISTNHGVSFTRTPFATIGTATRGACWTGSQFVITGYSGLIATSPDGVTWTTRSTAAIGLGAPDHIYGVAALSNGLVAAVTSTGKIIASDDGITWTLRYSGAVALNSIIKHPSEETFIVGARGTSLILSNLPT